MATNRHPRRKGLRPPGIHWKKAVAAWLAALTLVPLGAAAQQYRVGVCDWMMLKRQKIGEFQLAKDVGADGVEMDMGPLGQREQFDNKLREAVFQELFPRTADSLGVAVPSVAMSGFFGQSLLRRDNYLELTADCLQTMRWMKARVAFLPLGGTGTEWLTDPAQRALLVGRLYEMGEMAVREGMVIGIRTGLDAKESRRLLKDIRSDGIKIYYNLQDAVDEHRDPCRELKTLGRKRVCQIHASLTDSVTLDRDPRIDLKAVRRTLDRMKWSGWLVVERSRDAGRVRDVKHNFGTNVAFLKRVFREE